VLCERVPILYPYSRYQTATQDDTVYRSSTVQRSPDLVTLLCLASSEGLFILQTIGLGRTSTIGRT
jgi:hypothetical protein